MKELHQRTDLPRQVLDHVPDLWIFEETLPDVTQLEGWDVRPMIDSTGPMGQVEHPLQCREFLLDRGWLGLGLVLLSPADVGLNTITRYIHDAFVPKELREMFDAGFRSPDGFSLIDGVVVQQHLRHRLEGRPFRRRASETPLTDFREAPSQQMYSVGASLGLGGLPEPVTASRILDVPDPATLEN